MSNKISVSCPSCKAKFELSPKGEMPAEVRLRCSSCRTIFVLRRKAKSANLANPAVSSGAAPAAAPKAPPAAARISSNGKTTVLVANDNAEFCQVLRSVIESQTDYSVVESHDGEDAWRRLMELRPAVLVSDVALPGLYGFEVAERVRGESSLKDTKIILIASIYDRTRYKRRPTQLYGADDYVEKHHIPDMLVPKINTLLLGQKTGASVPKFAPDPHIIESAAEAIETPAPTAREEEVLRGTEPTVSAAEAPTGEAHEKAQRLARIIVSDVALYNQDLLEQGIREGNVESVLEGEMAEARTLFDSRIPPEVRQNRDYLGEAFQGLFETKRAEFRGQGAQK